MKKQWILPICVICLTSFANACGGDDNDDSKDQPTKDPVVITENTVALCTDELDNDNNGKADCDDINCEAFTFCAKAEEGQENTLAACKDGQDNDGDGKIDCEDQECKDFTICQEKVEENTEARCKDGLDNDGDGLIDCNDSECKAFAMCQEKEPVTDPIVDPDKEKVTENTVATCYDGEDNDGDGNVDCEDSGCQIFAFCANAGSKEENTLSACQDGIDNDGDGKKDCDDEECKDFKVCAEETQENTKNKENTAEACSDGLDNDEDGNIDCLDPDCWTQEICASLVGTAENTRELCSDGLDNDFNGKIDCEDDGCKGLAICTSSGQVGENTVELCKDKNDNDEDGKTDCEDIECQVYDFCKGMQKTGENTKESCNDGKDNDEDGLIDCADAECQQFKDICVDTCLDDHYKFLTSSMASSDSCGCGKTEIDGDCYTNISTVEEFKNMTDAKYVLKQNIDLGASTMSPLSTFSGVLKGDGHRITGDITQLKNTCGLFMNMTDAVIEDVEFSLTLNCKYTGTNATLDAGVIAPTASNSKFINIKGSSKLLVDDAVAPTSSADNGYTIHCGGFIGNAKESTFENLDVRGNVTLITSISYKDTKADSDATQQVNLGGIIGALDEKCSVKNLSAYTNVTSNLTSNDSLYYAKMAYNNSYKNQSYYHIGGIVGKSDTNIETVINRGSLKIIKHPDAKFYKPYATSSTSCDTGSKCTLYGDTHLYAGGVVGYLSANKSIKQSAMIGNIETLGYLGGNSDRYTYSDNIHEIIGGITGYAEGNNTIDEAYANLDIRLIPERNTFASGILGSADISEETSYLMNSYAHINLSIANQTNNKNSNYLYWGGGFGSHYNDDNISAKKPFYLLNNHLDIDYDFDNSQKNTTSILYLSNTTNQGTMTRVVNNFISGEILTKTAAGAENYTTITPAKGEYIYETYWNSDVFGKVAGGKHVDASAVPYSYNLANIPVTRSTETILGLLRYNSGQDGGVLSTNIPATLNYHDWKTIIDNEEHEVPVPVSTNGWY